MEGTGFICCGHWAACSNLHSAFVTRRRSSSLRSATAKRPLVRTKALAEDASPPTDAATADAGKTKPTKPTKPAKPDARDVEAANSLGETLESPALNSTLMNAMRDYFGDDGRELQDYMKRPRNPQGEPMFRVVLVGSGPREVLTVQKLKESGVISGLYYCPDEDRVCVLDMSKYARSATVSANYDEGDVVRFAKWVVADAVFVGPDRGGRISKESEAALAAAGITLFPHDVSAAIADGSLEVSECLATLAEESAEPTTEQFVE